MADTIAFLLVFLSVGGALLLLLRWLLDADRRRAEMTEEEYENRERGPQLLGTAMMTFDEMIRPNMKKAAEYRIDAEQGRLPGAENDGERLKDDE